jgi:hypothetical protein
MWRHPDIKPQPLPKLALLWETTPNATPHPYFRYFIPWHLFAENEGENIRQKNKKRNGAIRLMYFLLKKMCVRRGKMFSRFSGPPRRTNSAQSS